MTKKIIYFTAGVTATAGEIADIAKLNAAAVKPYDVVVVNGAANTKYGDTLAVTTGGDPAGVVTFSVTDGVLSGTFAAD